MKKFNLKSNKGITLIALIITIIVLLILAGVTIAAINGNESAMDKAKQAKNETSISEAKEAAILKATSLIQDYMDRRYVKNEANFATTYPKTGNYVAAEMNGKTDGDYTFTTSGTALTVSKSGTTLVTGTIDEDTGKITWTDTPGGGTGNVEQIDNPNSVYSVAKAGKVKRWDRVNYDPGTLTTQTANIDLPEGVSIEGTIDASKAKNWVVLDVTDQGDVLIIPTEYDTTQVSIYEGVSPFNNSVETLDDIVTSIYKNNSFAKDARSLRMEDISKAYEDNGVLNLRKSTKINIPWGVTENNKVERYETARETELEYMSNSFFFNGYKFGNNSECLQYLPSECFLANRLITDPVGDDGSFCGILGKLNTKQSKHVIGKSINYWIVYNSEPRVLQEKVVIENSQRGTVCPVVCLKSGIQIKKVDQIWELSEEFDDPLVANGMAELTTAQIDADTNLTIDQKTALKDTSKVKAVLTGNVPIPVGYTYLEGTSTAPGVTKPENGSWGVVIVDDNYNEWVWVPVNSTESVAPSAIYENVDGVNVGENNEEQYPKLELAKNIKGLKIASINDLPSLKVADDSSSSSSSEESGPTYQTNVTTTKKGASNIIDGIDRGNPNDTSSYREPALLTDYDKDYYEQAGFLSLEDMAEKIVADYEAMITSITKYGGFYVGRYELSGTNNGSSNQITNAKVQEGQTPMDYVNWHRLYQACRSFGNEVTTSTMIWGTQWDLVCRWTNDSGDQVSYSSSQSNRHSGDYDAKTGSNINDIRNNVCDLEGSRFEWTQEAFDSSSRAYRAGGYGSYWNGAGVRNGDSPNNYGDALRFSSHTLYKVGLNP